MPPKPIAASAAATVSSTAASTLVPSTLPDDRVGQGRDRAVPDRAELLQRVEQRGAQRRGDGEQGQHGRQRGHADRAGGRVDQPAAAQAARPDRWSSGARGSRSSAQAGPGPRSGRARGWRRAAARRRTPSRAAAAAYRAVGRSVGIEANAVMVAPPTRPTVAHGQVLRDPAADQRQHGQAEAGGGQRGGQHHLGVVALVGGERGEHAGQRRAAPRRWPRRRSGPGAGACRCRRGPGRPR